MSIGVKYPDKLNENPPPGYYDLDTSINLTKPTAYSTFIKEDQAIKIDRQKNPDAGQYDPHKEFGDIP